MRKIFAAALIVVATFGAALAQSQSVNDAPNMGIAPKFMNGPGRADVRVFDGSGNPISHAKVKLESKRTDGYFCETDWGLTNDHGIIVMPTLHMGHVTLRVRADGFKSQDIELDNSTMGEPIHVNMVHK
jgi:hypothetical protein